MLKKYYISILIIIFSTLMISCGEESGETEKDENGNPETSAEPTDSDTSNEEPASQPDSEPENPAASDNDSEATGDEPSDAEPTRDEQQNTGDDEPTDFESDTELFDKFVGRWAQKIIYHSSSSTSLMKNVPSVTVRYIVADIFVNDRGELDMDKVDRRTCRTDNQIGTNALNSGTVHFNEPQSKFNYIYHYWKTADIPGHEGTPFVEVAKSGDDILFRVNKDYELRGANMENPETEPMMTSDSDPRIFDQDEDGHAAFTVKFNGFVNAPMYYVQRLSYAFNGKLTAEGRIEGNVEWLEDQYTHQETPDLTLRGQKTTVTFTEKSRFQFIKVAEDMDCETLLEKADAGEIFDITDPYADEIINNTITHK